LLKNEKNVELARKIMAELPELLAPQLGSTENEKGQLKLFPLPKYSKLEHMDIRLITEIIRRQFGGEYVNEKDRFYWLLPTQDVPLPTSPLDKTEQAIKTAQNVGATSNVFGETTAPAPAPVPPAAAPIGTAPAAPTSAPNDAKPSPAPEPQQPAPPEKPKEEPAPKQPSPLAVFMGKYCSTCADQSDGCNPKNAAGREKMQRCFEVLQILFLGDIRDNLIKPKQFFRRGGSQQTGQQSNSQPQQPAETFFVENGIVWANSQTGQGKPCNKAYEEKNRKDGVLTQEYTQLVDAATKKKGFGGYYHYIVDGPHAYVGRIKTEKESEKK
jgi:hypothetical protein